MCDDNRSLTNDGRRRESIADFTASSSGGDSTEFIFTDPVRPPGSNGPEINCTSPPGIAPGNVPTHPSSHCEAEPSFCSLQPQPLEGIVTLVQRTEEEPPTNWYRFFSKAILTIFLLPIFLILGFASLILAIAFAIIGFTALSSIFNPVTWMTALFELLEVLVLGRLQRNDQQTVYRGLVRDTENRTYAFYLYGALRNGILVEGHRVRLFGDWHRENRRDTNERGTLFVCQGQDLTTGTTLCSARNAWRPIFFILLVLLIAAVGVGITNLPLLIQEGSTFFYSLSR